MRQADNLPLYCARSLTDRTKASDAFNAGSIPVGHIFGRSYAVEENNNMASKFVEWIKDVIELIKDNKRIVILVVCVICGIVAAVTITTKLAKRSEVANEVLEEDQTAKEEEYVIPDEPLQKDAYPEINALMKKYYSAVANSDITTIEELRTGLDDKERIVIEKKAQYVESYPNIICYTKPGPTDMTYLVFVNYEVKLKDFDELIPGMNVWYVCEDINNRFYINEDPQNDKVIEYCKIVSVQDDVQDLSNTINVKYNEVMASNEELAAFMEDLGVQMKVEVGEELAKAEMPEEPEEPVVEEEPETDNTPEFEEVKTVRATTVVNVRASDSEQADKVGKAQEGQEFKLIEEKANGWSQIEFAGAESAFIKSQYLETVKVEKVASVGKDEEDKTEEQADTTAEDKSKDKDKKDETKKEDETKKDESKKEEKEDASNVKTSGSVTAQVTLNVRSKASTESEKLGTLYPGDKLEVVEKMSDGWTKVKYHDSIGYVKTEFVE